MSEPIPAFIHLLRAKDLMDRSYAEPLDVATLAREACASEAHLARSFKRAFGETPHRYLTRRRIERAQELLRATDPPLTEMGSTSDSIPQARLAGRFTRSPASRRMPPWLNARAELPVGPLRDVPSAAAEHRVKPRETWAGRHRRSVQSTRCADRLPGSSGATGALGPQFQRFVDLSPARNLASSRGRLRG